MKALTCEMCGSTNLIKEDGVFVCQSCGIKYSVDEAKRMVIEGTVDVKGTVKVDVSDELKNLYEIARRSKDNNNSENALKYYDMIVVKDPSSWEANFCVVYYRAMSCKIAEIRSAAYSVANCLDSVCILIKENVQDAADKNKAIKDIFVDCFVIADMLSNAAKNHYESIDIQIQSKFMQEYINNAVAARDIMYVLGNAIILYFGEDKGLSAAEAWKKGIIIHSQFIKYLQDKQANLDMINEYTEKIKKYDISYQAQVVETSNGCYLATAVYGSYDCPEVWVLRRFRDYTLAETWYGRIFIRIYYAISPILVRWFGKIEWFKIMFRTPLNTFVNKLRSNGVDNTPYEDRMY